MRRKMILGKMDVTRFHECLNYIDYDRELLSQGMR